MSDLLLPPLTGNPNARFHENLPAGFGEGVGAAFRDPLLQPGLDLAPVQQEIVEAEGLERPSTVVPRRRGVLPRLGETQLLDPDGLTPLETPEKLNEEFGGLGLKFDRPTRRGVAEILAREKREERIRQDVLSRAPSGALFTTASLGVSFAAAALDPLNVAAAFVPVAREGRLAGVIARLGTVTRQRLATGALEGAVGNAAIEPAALLMSEAQQRDYTYADALLNITLGAGLGAGFRFVGGVVGDRMAAQPPAVREAAGRAAIAQMAEGRRVDVDPILRAQEFAFLDDPNTFLADPVSRRAPEAQEFSLGPLTGKGTAARFVDYTPVRPGDRLFLESVVADLDQTQAGYRLFREAEIGGQPDVMGVKATTPEWFQQMNRAVAEARQDRRRVQKQNKKLPLGKERPLPPVPPVLTRENVRKVAQKMIAGEPLGTAEGGIAEIIAAEARQMRERNAQEIVSVRQDRVAEREREIDEVARREADPRRDATADFDAADRADVFLADAPREWTPEAARDMADRESALIGREAGEEANFEAALLNDIRDLLGEDDLRMIDSVNAMLARAEDYAAAVRTAGACLVRA